MKYNCNNALDFLHELKRYCNDNNCKSCFYNKHNKCELNIVDIDQDFINKLQNWSDNNQIILSVSENAIITNIFNPEYRIMRINGHTHIVNSKEEKIIRLSDNLFTFIDNNTSISIKELRNYR